MNKQATSALQMARECIAATINQDDTLTAQEAREHASMALTYIERAEAASDAMREALAALCERSREIMQYTNEYDGMLIQAIANAKAALALAKGEETP